MKKIQLNSPEFNRVLKNMQFENLELSQSLQEKALEIVNSGIIVTPTVIKEALANDKYKKNFLIHADLTKELTIFPQSFSTLLSR